MNKLIAGMACALVASTGLTACGGNSSSSSSSGGSSGGKVILVAKANSADYWTRAKHGAEAAGKDLGVSVSFNGPDTESEGDKQLNQLQNAVNAKPLGIGFAPQDGAQDGAGQILDQAKSANIPVVTFDTPLSGSSDAVIANVASDNSGMGAAAADHMCQLTGGKGNVAIIEHGLVGTAAARRDGFKAELASKCSGLKVVDTQNGESDPAKSHDKAQGILQAHPDLVGFFGTDDDSVIGIADEIKAMNSKAVAVGVDISPDELTLVKSGAIAGTMVQNPYQMGYDTVKLLVEASKGTKPASANVKMPAVWVTKDNLNDADVQKVVG